MTAISGSLASVPIPRTIGVADGIQKPCYSSLPNMESTVQQKFSSYGSIGLLRDHIGDQPALNPTLHLPCPTGYS